MYVKCNDMEKCREVWQRVARCPSLTSFLENPKRVQLPEGNPFGESESEVLLRGRPPFSFTQMAMMALECSNDDTISTKEILKFILGTFPFYRRVQSSTQLYVLHRQMSGSLSTCRWFYSTRTGPKAYKWKRHGALKGKRRESCISMRDPGWVWFGSRYVTVFDFVFVSPTPLPLSPKRYKREAFQARMRDTVIAYAPECANLNA